MGCRTSSIYSYEDMDKFRDNKTIDAVYVALPNSMHAEYTIRSAKAGKHVLCEKPMSTTVKEAEDMIAACKAANVKLMIAYRLHYEPLHLKAVKLIRDGALGKVQTINGAFGFNAAPGAWRLNKALAGGGSLFDVGIYVLNACRYLTGEEPVKFTAVASTVDQDGRFEHGGGECVVDDEVSFGRGGDGQLHVWGADAGVLQGVCDRRAGWRWQPAFDYDGAEAAG